MLPNHQNAFAYVSDSQYSKMLRFFGVSTTSCRLTTKLQFHFGHYLCTISQGLSSSSVSTLPNLINPKILQTLVVTKK